MKPRRPKKNREVAFSLRGKNSGAEETNVDTDMKQQVAEGRRKDSPLVC